jgi:hypothetical protein
LLARRPPATSLGRPTSTRFASTQATTSSARNLLYGAAFAAGLGLFSIYYLDSRSALHRYVLTPTLRALADAETGHKIAVKALKYGVAAKDKGEDDAVIHSEVRSIWKREEGGLTCVVYRFGARRWITRLVWRQGLTRTEKPLTVRGVLLYRTNIV